MHWVMFSALGDNMECIGGILESALGEGVLSALREYHGCLGLCSVHWGNMFPGLDVSKELVIS